MKKKDLTHFVRFGSLNLNKQQGFGERGFHKPPAPRGFYAFPYTVQEFFLIGSLPKTQPHQFPKTKLPAYDETLPAEELEKIKEDIDAFDWDGYYVKVHKVKQNIRKEFRKTSGCLWHHLGDHVENHEVIARNGSWVKTSLMTWQKAFKKCCLEMRYGDNDIIKVTSINESKKTCGRYVRDSFEVFFDEKVG
ncbi:hypothetical protein [Pinibacter soli]|uniref:Uncharacterized protein n=1 Tax=Pinibacter soli TaxID=3044211 RepID=A0ABT6RDX7_9BACT|nr:hypothetical protein [Pinibacter soli]MDI3320784.1 hypothetical protein [Pinibacter soli]